MMERQVLVVSTGGREGFAMVRGIRSAGVFCVPTQAGAKLEIPEETRGAVVIGAADDAVRSSIDALRAKGLPVLAFGGACASLCEALGGEITGHAVTSQLKDVHFANIGVCSGVDGGMRMIDSAEYLSLPQGCRTLSVCEGATIAFDDGKGVSAGFQFIPEAHDVEASEIIGNFLWNVLHLEPNYNCESFIEQTVREIRAAVGDGQAVCVLSGGVDSTLQVKLLTAQNEIKVFSLAQNIRLNGSSISTTSEAGRNTFLQALRNNPVSNGDSKDPSPQIILYKLSADGLINSVETAKEGDNGNLLVGYTTGPNGKVQYKSGTKTFRMKVSADSSTAVFRVPADMAAADDEDFDAPGVSAFKHDNNYTIAAYNVNDGGVAKAIVVWDSVSKSMPSDTSAFAIVDKVVSSVKEDGMETQRLYALSNGKYIELDAYDTETLLVPSGTEQRHLKRGDGIRYETNANGEISGIELEYDITKPYTAQNYSSEFSRVWAFSGVVYSKDSNNLVTVKGADKDFAAIDKKYLDPNNRIAMLAGGNVYIYDQEADRVTRGTTDDIFDRKVCGDDASRIYARFNYESCKDIVIYKMK